MGDEVESFEMRNLEAVSDGNIKMALGCEMEGLGKVLGRKGSMQALMWPLKEAKVSNTVDSIREIKKLTDYGYGSRSDVRCIPCFRPDSDHTNRRLTVKIDSGVEGLQEQGTKLTHPEVGLHDLRDPAACPSSSDQTAL